MFLFICAIAVALGLLHLVVPGAPLTVGTYAAAGAVTAATQIGEAYIFLRRIFRWMCGIVIAWFILLFLAVWTGWPWAIYYEAAIGIVTTSLAIAGLIVIRKFGIPVAAAILSHVGDTVSGWLPLWWTNKDSWFWKAVKVILSPTYVPVLPIKGTAEIMSLVGKAEGLADEVVKAIVRFLASVNVVLWFVTMLVMFQSQHGLTILTPLTLLLILGAILLLIALGQMQLERFSGGAVPFIVTLGTASLVLMALVAIGHLAPDKTREIVRSWRVDSRNTDTSDRINREGRTQTGRVYYTTIRRTAIKPCNDCVVDNGRIIGHIGNLQLVSAGSKYVSVGDEEPAEANAVTWVRAHPTIDNDERNGFNTGEIVLLFKDDTDGGVNPNPAAENRMLAAKLHRADQVWFYPTVILFGSIGLAILLKRGKVALVGIALAIVVLCWQSRDMQETFTRGRERGIVQGYDSRIVPPAAALERKPEPPPQPITFVMEVANCSERAADVFRVENGKEILAQMVSAKTGYQFRTQREAIWRIRDTATGKLVREVVNPAPNEIGYRPVPIGYCSGVRE